MEEERSLDVGEIARVQRGQSTHQFEKAKKKVADIRPLLLKRNPSSSSSSSATASVAVQQLDPSLSFSIIFRGAHTLDLMAKSEGERNEICDTLDQVLRAYQRGKSRVCVDILLLRYVWLDIDKSKTGYMNAQQACNVLQAINFEMKQKDVQSSYDKFGKVIGLNRMDRRRGLTFEQSATFLHKVRDCVRLCVPSCF